MVDSLSFLYDALEAHWQVVEIVAIVLVVLVLLFYVIQPCCSRVVGKAMKTLLQTIDKKVLGVNVSFGHLNVNLCRLQVIIDGLTVENPEGYSTPFLLKMEDVHLHFSLMELLCSFGKRIKVQQLELDGVEVNVEKTMSSSNLQDVLAFLASKATPAPQERERMRRPSESEEVERGDAKASPCGLCSCCGCCSCWASEPVEAKSAKRKIDIHSVVVHRASVNLQAWMFKMKLRAADMDFQDLTAETRGQEAQVIAQLLLESLLMSVLANLPAGEYVSQAWERRRNRGSSSCSSSDSEASTFSLFSGGGGSACGSSSDDDEYKSKSPCSCCG